LLESITGSDLEAKIYRSAVKDHGHRGIIEPDCSSPHPEMKRKRYLVELCDEYIEAHPEGYRYSRFL
jgi:hypothetical protein